ncbi:MAG: autotransporter outer membrane beta-barrel domain-containing protein [Puniceicoccales bacterium]|jgi:outer membrane autotransporter protein|nr:autotransporter outer membrane beta-barrel domain-containing protein [Puniceicoccales bacterium]
MKSKTSHILSDRFLRNAAKLLTISTLLAVNTASALLSAELKWAAGGSGNWNTTETNWEEYNATPGVFPYSDGDHVYFKDISNVATAVVTITASSGVYPSTVNFENNGGVSGTAYALQGKLGGNGGATIKKSGKGEVGLYGDNSGFGGSLEFAAGTIRMQSSQNLIAMMESFKFDSSANGNANNEISQAIRNGERANVPLKISTARNNGDLPTLIVNSGKSITIDNTAGNAQRVTVSSRSAGSIHLEDNASLIFNGENGTQSINLGNAALLALTAGTGARYLFQENNFVAVSGMGAAINTSGHLFVAQADFINNKAMEGGALYSGSNAFVVCDSVFVNNSALSNYGGAASARGDYAEFVNTDFIQNSAITSGGAIYSTSVKLKLQVDDSRSSTFAGNTVSGTANSISLLNGNLAVNTDGNGVLDMRDPMSAIVNSGISSSPYVCTISKLGSGIWKIAGDNQLKATNGYSTLDFVVKQGTLHLYGTQALNYSDTRLGLNIAQDITSGRLYIVRGRFILESGTILEVGGTNNNPNVINADQELTIESGAIICAAAADASLVLNDSAQSQISGSLNLSATVGQTLTLAAQLVGAGGIDKQGAGKVILIEKLDYTGDTSIAAGGGELVIEGTLGTGTLGQLSNYVGTIKISNSTRLTLDQVDGQVLSGNIQAGAGAGTFIKAGAGILTLSGNNQDFAGAFEQTGGIIQVASRSNLLRDFSNFKFAADASKQKNTEIITAINTNASQGEILQAIDVARASGILPALDIAENKVIIFDGSGASSQRLSVSAGNAGSIHLNVGAGLTFQNNKRNSGDGGAISLSGSALLALTASSDAHYAFKDNAAESGGAISNDGALVLESVNFHGNRATAYNGGAIRTGSSTLSLSGTDFISNNAAQQGGAVYGYNSSMSFTDVELRGNTANQGGAIYSDKNLLISGAFFVNNTAEQEGGAIYSSNGDLALENVAFWGNQARTGTTAEPNSLSLGGTVLRLQGAANIYFDDPVHSVAGDNRLVKTGSGIAQFAGENRLDTGGTPSSTVVSVDEGELRLVAQARFDAAGSVLGTFDVGTDGTLSGQGTFIAPGGGFVVNGTLSPDSFRYAIPNFDTGTNTFDSPPSAPTGSPIGSLVLVGRTHLDGTRFAINANGTLGVNPAERNDFIRVDGDVSLETGSKIHLVLSTNNASGGGSFVFLEKSAGDDFGVSDNIVFSDVVADRTFVVTGTVDGYSLNARANAVVERTASNGKELQIRFDALQSLDLTWTNETGNTRWSATPADLNWTNGLSGDALEKRYRDGDRVTFSDIGVGVVSIAQGGVLPGKVYFTNTVGNDYVVNGDILAADASVTIEKTGGGALTLTGNIVPALTVSSGLVSLGAQAIVNDAKIKAGATLSGVGGVARANFESGAILVPGTEGTIGTLFLGEYGGTTHFDGIILKNDVVGTASSDLLHITGDARFGFAPNTLDISDGATNILWGVGRYTILSVIGEGAKLDVGDLSQTLFAYKGIGISAINSRLKATVEKVSNSTGQHLVLSTYADSSLVLTWIGRAPGIGAWDTLADNWRQDPAPAREVFHHGDVVVFDATLSLSENVTLNVGIVPEGVIVGAMSVKGALGGGFVFAGGQLIGVATQTSGYALSAATGSLSVEADAAAFFQSDLEFDNIVVAGRASFAGAVNLRDGRALTVSPGGVVTVLDRAALGGVAQVANGGSLVFDLVSADTTFDYAGRITGAGGVEKKGPGLLSLSGESTYRGGTLVRAGVLAITRDANLGSGTNTLDGGTLRLLGAPETVYVRPWVLGAAGGVVENENAAILSAALSGLGAFTKCGAGELTLKGDNTYAGDTAVRVGALKVEGTLSSNASPAVYSGNISVNDAAHLEFAHDVAQTLDGVLVGAGTVAKTGAGALRLVGANAHSIRRFDNRAGNTEVTGSLAAAEVHNYAAACFAAAEVQAEIHNEGVFSATRVTGDIVNTGTLLLNVPLTRWDGTLHNNGGLVDFVNAGRRLEVRTLRADGATEGLVRMDIDLVTPGNSDILAVGGEITGKHRLLLHNVTPSAQSHLITRESGASVTVIQAVNNVYGADEAVSGILDGGLYRFSVTEDGLGGYNLARVDSYGSTGQSAVNAAGAIAIGWFSMQDNLTRRLGELRMAEWAARVGRQKVSEDEHRRAKDPSPVAPTNEQTNVATLNSTFWVRAFGERVETHLGIRGISSFSEYQYGANIGYDINFLVNKDCRTFLGLFVGYQGARRNFHDGFASDGKTESVSVGLYGTVVHADGWFLDGILRGQTAEMEYDAIGDHGEFTNRVFGASIEAGWHFALQPSKEGVPVSFWQDWFIEPGFQFAYSHVFADSYKTDHGVHVWGGDSDIFRLLAGLRFGRTIYTRDYGEFQPYARIGVEYQDSLGGSIRVESERFVPTTDGVRAVFGLGLAWQLDESQQVHLEYEASLGEKYDRPWGVTLSFRKRF